MRSTGRNDRSGRTNGYIIEQLLITLMICAFLIPVCTALLLILFRAMNTREGFQDEVGIAQLRHVINISENISCETNRLNLTCHGKKMYLARRGDCLDLLSPGTQIFLSELESVSFEIRGNLVFVRYAHEGKPEKERCLGLVS